MNAEGLLDYYERIADAPDAVARFRRFILDLAVRGKLVAQDHEDEPAPKLFERIQMAKATADKVPKRVVKTSSINDPPFTLPNGWMWAPIREVTADHGQKVPSSAFTYIDVSAIDKEAGIIYGHRVLEASKAPSRARKVVRKGDVVYSCVRPYLLNVAVIEEDFEPEGIASTAFAVLDGLGLVLPRYTWIALRSPYLVRLVEDIQRGQAYPAINDADFAQLPFPLPPLAEQHRIVAKVDELMALCDQLETAGTDRETQRDRLTVAAFGRLSAPDPATFEADASFALEVLPALTARPDQIKQLRRTILSLAIRGRLVAQNPRDGKACIASSHALKRGRDPEASGVTMPDDAPFSLPDGWSWTRLGSAGDWGSGSTPSRGKTELYGGGITWLKSGELNDNRFLSGSEETVTKSAVDAGSFRLNKPGDVLIAMYGATIGKVAILAENAVTNQAVCGCTPLEGVYNQFLFYFLLARRQEFRQASEGGAQPNISKAKIVATPFPVPPLAEQHRIVAKVDELMALCDQLEASLNRGGEVRARLLEAVLAEALSPEYGGIPLRSNSPAAEENPAPAL